jgi:hypothetical protein
LDLDGDAASREALGKALANGLGHRASAGVAGADEEDADGEEPADIFCGDKPDAIDGEGAVFGEADER